MLYQVLCNCSKRRQVNASKFEAIDAINYMALGDQVLLSASHDTAEVDQCSDRRLSFQGRELGTARLPTIREWTVVCSARCGLAD